MAHKATLAAKVKIAHAAWLNFISDVMEENAQREPWLCDCRRAVVTTVMGCHFCWAEQSEIQLIELSNPDYTYDNSRWGRQ